MPAAVRVSAAYLTWHKACPSSVTARRSLYRLFFQFDIMYFSTKVVRKSRFSAVFINSNAQYFLRRTKNEIFHTDILSFVNVKHILVTFDV